MSSPNFIGIYENAMPKETCEYFIKFADKLMEQNPSEFKSKDPAFGGKRKDYSIFIGTRNPEASRTVNAVLQQCLDEYVDEYQGLHYSGRFMSLEQKLQVTPVGGGFHSWHNEHATLNTCDRVLAWMVYLNDIPHGEGETEFLHQQLRVNPKQGTVMIWPAGWTHCHRGNPPHTTTKYIITGWYNLVQDL